MSAYLGWTVYTAPNIFSSLPRLYLDGKVSAEDRSAHNPHVAITRILSLLCLLAPSRYRYFRLCSRSVFSRSLALQILPLVVNSSLATQPLINRIAARPNLSTTKCRSRRCIKPLFQHPNRGAAQSPKHFTGSRAGRSM